MTRLQSAMLLVIFLLLSITFYALYEERRFEAMMARETIEEKTPVEAQPQGDQIEQPPKVDYTREEAYKCPGVVVHSLCYYGSTPPENETQPYESDIIEITPRYNLEVKVGEEFEFSLQVKNKANESVEIVYMYTLGGERYESTVFNHFEGVELLEIKKGEGIYSVTLEPGETKEITGTFMAKQPNLVSVASRSFFILFIEKIDGNDKLDSSLQGYELHNFVGFNEGIKCGDHVFPASYDGRKQRKVPTLDYVSIDWYRTSKCIDGVFYPGFEGASDSDCYAEYKTGARLVDGKCIKEISPRDPAIGLKNTLFIFFGKPQGNLSESCIINNDMMTMNQEVQEMTNRIEDYFDSMAKLYLNETEGFLSFNFSLLGPFDMQQLDLDNNASQQEIYNRIIKTCAMEGEERFDEVIITGIGPSEAAGWAGRPIIAQFSFETLTHELAHSFGCNHINNYDLGTGLQWYNDIMGMGRHDTRRTHTLQVCRGEMGWVDLDGNGVIEVKEFLRIE